MTQLGTVAVLAGYMKMYGPCDLKLCGPWVRFEPRAAVGQADPVLGLVSLRQCNVAL